jgi:hypothetical protein
MFRAAGMLFDRQGPPIERFSFSQGSAPVLDSGEVVQSGGDIELSAPNVRSRIRINSLKSAPASSNRPSGSRRPASAVRSAATVGCTSPCVCTRSSTSFEALQEGQQVEFESEPPTRRGTLAAAWGRLTKLVE